MFGNSKHNSVQLPQLYKPPEMPSKPLTAKYLIYDVDVSLIISVIFPPKHAFIRHLSANCQTRISLYFVPFFSPTFSNTPISVKNSKSRVAVLSEVSLIDW